MSDDQSGETQLHEADKSNSRLSDEANPSLDDHIERTIGQPESVFHEHDSDVVHVDIHWVKATRERPFHVLVTTGMSARPMDVPVGESSFAELIILLPSWWPMDKQSLTKGRYNWPIQGLHYLAKKPHLQNTWLGKGHTISNGDPAEPFANNTGFCCMLLLPSMSLPKASRQATLPDGTVVNFWALYPLYADEINYKLEHGLDALIDKFEAAGVSDIVDIHRASVMGGNKPTRKKWFGLF
jgi:hypothetical protein